MARTRWCLAAMAVVACALALAMRPAAVRAGATIALHEKRQAASDLEIGGELAGVPAGQTRFVAWSDLDALPQDTAVVSDDTNFVGTVKLSGVRLDKLNALLGAKPGAAMLVAICDDNYNAHYPAEYLKQHAPLLVLRVNGLPPDKWPVGADGAAMGPYMVSHASFKPAWKELAHEDEAQVPWGVVRVDFRTESAVYAPITPPASYAKDEAVQQGFAIAKQNCFRCHSTGGEGGTKSDRTWGMIAHTSMKAPAYFDALVRDPKAADPGAQMAASPQYDAATLAALRAYFKAYMDGAK